MCCIPKSLHTSLAQQAQQRLRFLHQMRRAQLYPPILTIFLHRQCGERADQLHLNLVWQLRGLRQEVTAEGDGGQRRSSGFQFHPSKDVAHKRCLSRARWSNSFIPQAISVEHSITHKAPYRRFVTWLFKMLLCCLRFSIFYIVFILGLLLLFSFFNQSSVHSEWQYKGYSIYLIVFTIITIGSQHGVFYFEKRPDSFYHLRGAIRPVQPVLQRIIKNRLAVSAHWAASMMRLKPAVASSRG